MSKLFINTVDGGARVSVSVSVECDADVETRFHIPRPSHRPTSSLDDVPTVRRMVRPPRSARFGH